ncbi:MAG: nucleoside deaminase [Clostridiales bacterium]|nr:nucleoside deaminase [Clostridiales bacterium]
MKEHRSDSAFMALALAEAEHAAAAGEVPVGAVLVYCGTVIACTRNRVEEWGDPTAHAEMLAIREGAKKLGARRLSDCILYVTLEPCAMCSGAIVNARLKKVVFGAFEPRTGCCGSVFDLLDHAFLSSVPAVGGVMEEECGALLASFFSDKR